MEGYQWGERRKNEGKGTGNKKHKWQVRNRQVEVKNRIGNGGAKELMCMTHGHELKGEIAGGNAGTGQVLGRRGQRGEKWVNYNTITNKMYFKKYLFFNYKPVCAL